MSLPSKCPGPISRREFLQFGALALGGLGWSLSHFSTPLIMGFLADRFGLVTGFYVIGLLALASAVLIAWARSWAFRTA